MRSWFGFVAIGMLSALLFGCGGGGGGGVGGEGDSPNVLRVTVVDDFGTRVPGAIVSGGGDVWSTDANGVAPLLIEPEVAVNDFALTVSRDGFLNSSTTTKAPLKLQDVLVTLKRIRLAAGGSLTSRSGVLPAVIDDAERQLTFEVEIVVVDQDSRPIDNLTAAAFSLQACTPDPASAVVCVQSLGSDTSASYVPATAAPETLQLIPAAAERPYAAALLIDQSGSIRNSDPTDARLSSAKAFLTALGNDDRALLAVFAAPAQARIPTTPLTVYAPFRDRAAATASPASSPSGYFATLDSLPSLVGGRTPLYSAVDALRQFVVSDTTLPAGLAKSIVVFTDGTDTLCDPLQEDCDAIREATIQAAIADDIRLFTIGLSTSVDTAALGELANRTGGALLYADTPEQLLSLYGSAGKLLSMSLPTYRLRWTIQASEAGVFLPGNAILGRVQVTAPNNTFEVPIVIGLR